MNFEKNKFNNSNKNDNNSCELEFESHCGEYKLIISDFSKQIIPQNNKILVLRIKIPSESHKNSLIFFQEDTTETKFLIGLVVAIGENVLKVKKDDYIIYGKWAGLDIKVKSNEYMIIKEDDISTLVDFEKIKIK